MQNLVTRTKAAPPETTKPRLAAIPATFFVLSKKLPRSCIAFEDVDVMPYVVSLVFEVAAEDCDATVDDIDVVIHAIVVGVPVERKGEAERRKSKDN